MKLSIITVNFNNAAGLQKTIESVVNQSFTDYEYIIIDGGSSDESVDIIQQYADKITYWVSEPDKGIYHAMNKGILQAKGEYCQFLNSGDWFIDRFGLQYVFDKKPAESIIYCDIQFGKRALTYDDRLTFLYFFDNTIPHQSAFIRRSLFSILGFYNEENKIVSDWEFYMKAIINSQCSYQHIPYLLVFYDDNGLSETNRDLLFQEREKVLRKNYPLMYDDYKQLISLKQENQLYRNSRLIQFIHKIQRSNSYIKIREIF